MSELTSGDKMALAGFGVNAKNKGRTIKLLETNLTFIALVAEQGSFDPELPVGSDLREATILEAPQSIVPVALLNLETDSQVPAEMNGVRINLVKRESNPASPFVRFEAVKVL